MKFLFALAQHRRALRDQVLQPAIELVEFLDHQRHRAVGARAVALELLVGGRDQLLEALDIEFARFVAGLGKLPGEKPVHAPYPAASRMVVMVMVWL